MIYLWLGKKVLISNVLELYVDTIKLLGISYVDSGSAIQYGVVDFKNQEDNIRGSGLETLRYDIGDVRCEISTKNNYRIRFLGENIVNSEGGFCLVVFDKELKLAADCVKLQGDGMSRN